MVAYTSIGFDKRNEAQDVADLCSGSVNFAPLQSHVGVRLVRGKWVIDTMSPRKWTEGEYHFARGMVLGVCFALISNKW